MSWRETNIRALVERFPGLWESLGSLQIPAGVPEPELLPSRSQVPTLKLGGRLAYSSYKPLQDAERSLPQLEMGTDVALMAGWGLGYAALHFVALYPEVPLIVVEPDPRVFRLSLDAYDLTPVWKHPGLVLIVGGEPEVAAGLWNRFDFRNTQWIPFRWAFETYPSWMSALESAWQKQSTQARVNEDTLRKFYQLWIRHHVKNGLVQGLLPLSALKDVERGRPIVIAAAGPSLSLHWDLLKENRQAYVLIAVDTAWNALRGAGLTPDYLVVVDGQYWNARHVDGPLEENTRVVAELTAHPRTFRLAPGRTFVGTSNVPFLKAWEEACGMSCAGLATGGSVATAAWSLALYLGASQVWFAGLDLGYPRSGTHVQGSQFEERFLRSAFRLIPAETESLSFLAGLPRHPHEATRGGWVLSDVRMDLYRAWLEADLARHPQIQAYNLSPIGSLIHGLLEP
ncbi:MAG: DUF115 domain-containing protein, partial [Spirochaetales bacterium]|nr:DUF115 domain-containing protein [Spirochaetales bacterium]